MTVIGCWVWITGNTKQVKEALKELKCVWHSKRKCWDYKPSTQKKYRSAYSSGSLNDLAASYGYRSVNLKTEETSKKQTKTKVLA